MASVQVGPGARLREAKCLMEVVRSVMDPSFGYDGVLCAIGLPRIMDSSI